MRTLTAGCLDGKVRESQGDLTGLQDLFTSLNQSTFAEIVSATQINKQVSACVSVQLLQG